MSTDTLRLSSRVQFDFTNRIPQVAERLSDEVLAAVERALLDGETHYTVRPGVPALRRYIAGRLAAIGGPSATFPDAADHVVITSGENESLFVLLLALDIAAGSVLAASDDTGSLLSLCRLLGISISTTLRPDVRLIFRGGPEFESQAALGEPRIPQVTRVGGSLDKPLPALDADHSFIIGNLDSPPGLQSFRVGFLWGPQAYMSACRTWKQAFSICTAAPSQRAVLASLEGVSNG